MPEVRCVICQGTGYQGWPAGMGWTPCRACAAEELFRLQEETFHVRSEFGNHQMATVLRAARERVASCAECQGTGKTWEPIPAAPCPACRGTGRDNHMGMPPGVLWPRADGDFAKDTSGGRVPEQVTHWTADAETEPGAMAEPAAASMPEASDVPAFMTARAVGQRITYSRGA